MDLRCLPNDFTPLLTFTTEAQPLLQQALEEIITKYPPRDAYPASILRGICGGPTAMAYLFLHVSAASPSLCLAGHSARHWAEAYISGSRGHTKISPGGLFSEKLSFTAVRAAIANDLGDVRSLLDYVCEVLDGDYPDELLYGHAGVLYLLRLVRHWVPNSGSLVERSIEQVSERILSNGPRWTWRGKRYIGAAHGDIGIVTQLVLTTLSLAQRVEPTLGTLLDLQKSGGNWPIREDGDSTPIVEWCHGASGFIISLVSLRQFFPGLQDRIDSAVEKGREVVWEKGLLRKEPCLCHGILGNALVFSPGQRQDHFFALATPSRVAEARERDETLFPPTNSGERYSILMDYMPSAAWTWLVCKKESPKMILYNDV